MSKRGEGECESWVVASRLRDHLLSPKERKNHALWKQVLLSLNWMLSYIDSNSIVVLLMLTYLP